MQNRFATCVEHVLTLWHPAYNQHLRALSAFFPRAGIARIFAYLVSESVRKLRFLLFRSRRTRRSDQKHRPKARFSRERHLNAMLLTPVRSWLLDCAGHKKGEVGKRRPRPPPRPSAPARALPEPPARPHLTGDDLLGAAGVFGLAFSRRSPWFSPSSSSPNRHSH